jgi:MFS family permease
MEGRTKTLRATMVLGTFFLMLATTYASFSHIVSYITEHSD